MRFIWLIVVLGWTAIGLLSIPAYVVSQALGLTPWGYELPGDATLRKALQSCQIARYATREYVLCPQRLSFEAFPVALSDALIASEDRQFFDHDGIDKLAIAHGIATGILRKVAGGMGLSRRGGSTITQQLTRILFLDEREGFSRKLRELVLAPRIERLASKKQILTAYMNVVPHARGLNGFDAAARYLFGVPVQDINLGEAALLVGMLPAPNERDPTRHPQGALDSAVRVLERMAEQKMIGEASVESAAQDLLRRIRNGSLRRGATAIASEETRPFRDLAIAEAARHGADVGEDYRLITTMDLQVQGWVVQATEQIAGPYQAAGVFLRPNGEVMGIAGSRDYVESSLNRAFRMRQPIGSTGKLFVLVAAHENGIDPNREFPARPVDGRAWPAEPSAVCRGHPMTLSEALTNSCNRPYTWAAYEMAGRLKDIVHRFELKPPDAPALVPLGGIEASPLQLARAYATVANNGRLPRVRSLVAALGRRGNVLYVAQPSTRRVMTEQTAIAVRDALRSPVRQGTARNADSPYATVYGKTGTTTHDKDALFVGLTNDYVGAFWIGDDKNRSMHGIYGGGLPSRAFRAVTNIYYTSQPPRPAWRGVAADHGTWWGVPDVLQDRRRRYYVLLAMTLLVVSFTVGAVANLVRRVRGGRRVHWVVTALGAPYVGLAGLIRGFRRWRLLRG
jgi:penicillin-binding protein 1A